MKAIDRISRIGMVIVATITAGACGTGGAVTRIQTINPSPAMSLYVRNDNWHDMRVYFVPDAGGPLVRVGTVRSLNSAVLPLRGRVKSEIRIRGNVRFLLRPLASRDTYLTHYVIVGAGDRIELTVANQLVHSTLVLR